jgi:hypothetical protein
VISRLAGLLLLLGLAWLVSRILHGRFPSAAVRREVAPPGGEMVRDRVCNTFLPRSRALRVRIGGEDHFFCSDSCRSKALEQAGAREQAGHSHV